MVTLSGGASIASKTPEPIASRVHLVPTRGAAQPFRAMGDLFPRWTADQRERLTVGLGCSLNWGAARRLVGEFRKTHPDIDLIIEDGDEITLAERLNGRQIDLAIAPEGARRRGWHTLSLEKERLIAVLPEGHGLCAANEINPSDLLAEPILMSGDSSGDRAFRRAVVEALGGHPAFRHCAVQRDTLFDLVALGFGVTVSAGGAFGAFYPGVCLRPICSKASEIGFNLFWRADNEKPALTTFLESARLIAGAGEGGEAR
jgi:DNA-binding transcriptional LysR family regulator